MTGSTMGTAFGHLRGLLGGRSVVALEDGQLLARYEADGDEAAFEALLHRHGPMVLTTCRAVLRDEHDVEDAFQATFLVLARKAGSIRGSEALGGWLHRVAYRASVRAGAEAVHRRRKELQAAKIRMEVAKPKPEPDLAALLHDEIHRLPESLRLPVVLCDLEGLSYEQAAEQLRWSLPTLRHRLARARQKLKDRLTRRGLVAPVMAAPGASLPIPLAGRTLAAVLGKSTSADAVFLAQILLRGMLMTKLKLASAALVLLALASAGLAAGRNTEAPATDVKPTAKAGSVVEEPDALVEVRGIVVDPTGKPVSGAKVRATTGEPVRETTSGPDGRFRLRVPPPDSRVLATENSGYPQVAASASGFGLGWVKDALQGDVTIRLAEDGPPIEAKIIDIDGRPVTGALIRVKTAWVADKISFEKWAAVAKDQPPDSIARSLLGVSTAIETATGPDGRFKLAGIGRDRVATLVVTGPMIAKTRVDVIVYDGPEIRPARSALTISFPPRTQVFHARKFEAIAGPTRPIEGTIRDRDTGRGIEGLTIHATILDQRQQVWDSDIAARTDAEGRYRLLGMPAAPGYRLFIERTRGQAVRYPGASLKTPMDVPAIGPSRLDVKLKRGIVVRGRVTDKATGRPVTGYLEPFVFPDEPALADYPDLLENRGHARTNSDGRFELVAVSGRGLMGFRADRDEYVHAQGFESITGIVPKQGVFPTRPRCYTKTYHLLVGVDLDPRSESANVDLQVDPGRSVELAVVDPDGRPVERLKALGTSPIVSNFVPASESVVKVRALDPSRPRRVYVYHLERKLVGSIWLKGDEVGPLTVRMVPWGTMIGRFVDADGVPLTALRVGELGDTSPTVREDVGLTIPNPVNSPIYTNREGRFRIEALVPGLKYSFSLGAFPSIPGSQDMTVAPGEVKDLGDLKSPLPRR